VKSCSQSNRKADADIWIRNLDLEQEARPDTKHNHEIIRDRSKFANLARDTLDRVYRKTG